MRVLCFGDENLRFKVVGVSGDVLHPKCWAKQVLNRDRLSLLTAGSRWRVWGRLLQEVVFCSWAIRISVLDSQFKTIHMLLLFFNGGFDSRAQAQVALEMCYN